jgi:hypothetical protein
MTPEQYQQLKDAGWDDEKIQIHAMKRGLEMPAPEGEGNGILASIAKGITAPGYRAGQLLGGLAGRAMGYSKEQVQEAQSKEQKVAGITFSGMKKPGEGRGKQLLGEGVEAASYLTPVGRISKAIPGLKGLAAAGATAGYAYDIGSDLQQGKSTAEALTPGMGTLTGVLTPYAFAGAGKVLKGAGAITRYTTAQLTGLKPETITTLMTKPHAISEAQKAELSSLDLAKQLQASWRERMQQLSSTGRGYETIRTRGGTIDLGEDVAETVLGKYGLGVKDGRVIRTSKSQPIKPGDEAAFNDFLSLFGGKTQLTAEELLNARGSLDNLIHWDSTKSGLGKKIGQEIRARYDEIAGQQIPGLKDLDAKYGPERKLLNDIRKNFFEADGSIKPAALARMANLSKKNREIMLQKVEELVPGMGQKSQILMALNDIEAAGGQKLGQYIKGGVFGAGVATMNPFVMAMSVFAGAPAMAVPAIQAFGKARGYTQKAIQTVVNKLMGGEMLTSGETIMYRESVKEWLRQVSPGDQLLDSKLGQAALKANQEAGGSMGLSMKRVPLAETAQKYQNEYEGIQRQMDKLDPEVNAKKMDTLQEKMDSLMEEIRRLTQQANREGGL